MEAPAYGSLRPWHLAIHLILIDCFLCFGLTRFIFYISACSAPDEELARPEHVLIENVKRGPVIRDMCAEAFVQCSNGVPTSDGVQVGTISSRAQDKQPQLPKHQLGKPATRGTRCCAPATNTTEGCAGESSDEGCSGEHDICVENSGDNRKKPSLQDIGSNGRNMDAVDETYRSTIVTVNTMPSEIVSDSEHTSQVSNTNKTDTHKTAPHSKKKICRIVNPPKRDTSATAVLSTRGCNTVTSSSNTDLFSMAATLNCDIDKGAKGRKRPNYKREKNKLCPMCDVYLKDYDSVYDHLKLKHASQDGIAEWLSKTKTMMRVACDACSKTYSCKEQLAVHVNLVHTEHKTVQCKQCGLVVKSIQHLRGHVRRVHDDSASRMYLCHLCPARFKLKSYLSTHIKFVHTSNKKDAYKCSKCDHVSACLKYLANHELRVHNERRYACHYCDQLFNTAANMRRHERLLHECRNEKPHICETCGKRFTLKANMKHHIMTVHNKRFRYHCVLCQKGFPRHKQLQLHSAEVHSLEFQGREPSTCMSDTRENSAVPDSRSLNSSSATVRAVTAVDSTLAAHKAVSHNVKYIMATPQILQTFSVKDGDLV